MSTRMTHHEVMKCPTTPGEWRAISDKFAERWNIPHTCGALDGKHVNCKCPPNSGSLYYNYKGFYSIVLLPCSGFEIWSPVKRRLLVP